MLDRNRMMLSQATEDNIDVKVILDELNKTEDKSSIKTVKFSSKELSSIIPKDDLVNSKQIILRLLKEYYNIA